MKCAVNEKTTISKIPRDTVEIHMIRPIKKEKLEELLNTRKIEKISMSESCYDRIPKKGKKLLSDKGVEVFVERRRGRALDISLETMLKIIELRKDYQSIREIERVTNVPKSTVHYLLKYADRGKIKKGNTVFYLK